MLLSYHQRQSFVLRLNGEQLIVPVLNYRLSPVAGLQQNLFVWLALACLYRMVPVAGWRSWLRRRHSLISACVEAQLVGDIRGGDSFSDIYGLRNFLLGSLGVLAVLLVRREIVLLPQTYGPYKSWLSRCVARFILRRASIILSRDRHSLDTVRQLIGYTPRARFCPDVAFALEAHQPDSLAIMPALPSQPPACLIGVNVNGLMFNGGYTRTNMFNLKLDYRRFLERMLLAFLEIPDCHILLVPHTFAAAGRVESDPEACRLVMASVPPVLAGRVHLVTAQYDQNEIKGVIGLCDFFVGSRMHACIAALSQNIPTVGVAYSRKFAGVFDMIGAGDWVVDGQTTEDDQALNRTLDLFRRREQIRPELKRRVREAQDQLHAVFRDVLAMRFGTVCGEISVATVPDKIRG